jgi:hypothetical protein
MKNYILQNPIDLQAIISLYKLNTYSIVSVSIGNDDNVYIMFMHKGSNGIDIEYCAVVLQIDWQTGDKLNHYLIEFGILSTNVDFIQPISNHFLLLNSRATFYDRKTYDRNALILDEEKHILSEMCLGDGIQQCIVDSDNRIITGYADEGIFGNRGWNHPIGASGLIVWSDVGVKLWENKKHKIYDCYAINLGSHDELWFYFYTDFNLVQTDYKADTVYKPGIGYSTGLLFNKNYSSILFEVYDGINKSIKYKTMDFVGKTLSNNEECVFIDTHHNDVEVTRSAYRKYRAVIADRKEQFYCFEWT